MNSNKLTTPPAVEPVTSAELDAHLRGDGVLESVEPTLLTEMVVAAREFVELHTRRALITQTWTMFLDTLPQGQNDLGWWDGIREGSQTSGDARSIKLPIGDLQSVTSISTFSSDNTETTFADTNYFLNTNETPGEVVLNEGVVWPTFTRNRMGIKVVYVAGYGDAGTDVPGALRMAIKQLAAHWYENRELVKTQSDQNQAMAPMHVLSIINRYKVGRV